MIKVPNEPDAGHFVTQQVALLVGWIGANAKETCLLVVKPRAIAVQNVVGGFRC